METKNTHSALFDEVILKYNEDPTASASSKSQTKVDTHAFF
jgi:hypothetical protein